MMTSRTAIWKGLGLARRAGTGVRILFFANLGLAALAAYPIYRGVLAFTGHSGWWIPCLPGGWWRASANQPYARWGIFSAIAAAMGGDWFV